jgi:hypothetical protein
MTAEHSRAGENSPVIAVDGSESLSGRALFAISALSWCLEWLPRVHLRITDLTDENVALALDVFQFEHGINIDIRHANDRASPLLGADLYAAVAFRSGRHLRLAEARNAGIPTMLAIQFPQPEWFSASVLLRQPAAFDPRCFAADLGAIVKPWL